MRRLCLLFLAALLSFAWQTPASASGDFGCSPSARLSHKILSDCDNMALLGPGNDTRVNLALLLFDAHPRNLPARPPVDPDADEEGPAALFDWRVFKGVLLPAPAPSDNNDYAEGEGSRCRSNADGAAAFEAAVNAAKGLSGGERADLIAARRGLQPTCTSATGASIAGTADRMKSAPGKAFARYLQGAAAFYDGDYDTAAERFSALRTANQPWLQETARYMIGRVEVNRAQINAFDEYGFRSETRIDPQIIARAEAGLKDYAQAYPRGLYAISARGLLRRVYWLGGNSDKLAAEYAALFAQDPGVRGLDDATLAQEIDNKLLSGLKPTDVRDPIVLAVLDLARMRGAETDSESGCCGTPIAIAELEAQRPHFAGNPALFDYVLAAHAWFVDNKPDQVLRLIPDAARQGRFSYLQFSRQMLRGIALDARNDRNARGFWLDMLSGSTLLYQRPAVELALALHDERTAGLDRVFDAASPVHDPVIRETLLTHVAGAALLRRQAKDARAPVHERAVALFTLLYKDVTRGAYRDFLADQSIVPAGANYDLLAAAHPPLKDFAEAKGTDDYGCPPLKEIASQLARDPRGGKGRLCVAEFIRLNGFDSSALDNQLPKGELGSTPPLFPGPLFSRLELYKAIIADAAVPGGDKAYALYRAVNCYGPSGNNSCGGVEVPVSVRKAWFLRLKKEYPASSWAQEQRYYW